jgi:ribA/ribD-fused uncharacterized protein
MHDNRVTCPTSGCSSYLFGSEQWNFEDPNTVSFYPAVFEPLSNFFPAPFEIDGVQWPSVEHFMQAKKFEGTPAEETIRKAQDYHEAHLLGWTLGAPLRPDWDQVKLSYLDKALFAKFSQNQACREKLLGTGTGVLVQADTDLFWGANALEDGVTQGQNLMGVTLMRLREKLQAA